MNTFENKPLVLAFIIVTVVFLISLGGAIAMTMTSSGTHNGMSMGMNNNGLLDNISWLWIPTCVFFLLSILLGWGIFGKKKE